MNEFIKNQYLIFFVDEAYAIEIDKVLEIIEYKNVTKVPETPDYISGIINLRGQVIPVIDLRKRFKKNTENNNPRKSIIITKIEGNQLGLIADGVSDIIKMEEDKISPPPTVGSDYAHVFVKLIGVHNEKMHLILDTDKLINLSDFELLENPNE
ncbi:chemotaxis protein CheW [Eubacteriales bacterium OttesenSCG-928-G02]|nr:chemotaxis protein CheW [Eubacteriales bacterium OttesenSCG-928-G02]